MDYKDHDGDYKDHDIDYKDDDENLYFQGHMDILIKFKL